MNSLLPTTTKSMATIAGGIRTAFQIVSTTLLSLLVPLAFLLLSRLSTAHYLLAVSDSSSTQTSLPLLPTLFLHSKTTQTLLHLLISTITLSTLTHSLTGHLSPISLPLSRLQLTLAWLFLFLLQLTVGLGIEGSIISGIDGSSFGQDSPFLGRILFFFGLHETVVFWKTAVVRPVVDDTVFGRWNKKEMVEKVVVGMSYGGLWWWRVREEVEAVVMVPEVKMEMGMGIGVADFVGWWLYYLTVTIGVVRVVRGLGLAVVILIRRRWVIERQPATVVVVDDDDEKV